MAVIPPLTATLDNDLSISIIDDPDFNAYTQCTFNTAQSQVTLVQSANVNTGDQFIMVGPPQPIVSVSCHGTCIATWSDCFDHNGQPLGTCCAGYCASDKCRPWNDHA
jgi:hypothetical protein